MNYMSLFLVTSLLLYYSPLPNSWPLPFFLLSYPPILSSSVSLFPSCPLPFLFDSPAPTSSSLWLPLPLWPPSSPQTLTRRHKISLLQLILSFGIMSEEATLYSLSVSPSNIHKPRLAGSGGDLAGPAWFYPRRERQRDGDRQGEKGGKEDGEWHREWEWEWKKD